MQTTDPGRQFGMASRARGRSPLTPVGAWAAALLLAGCSLFQKTDPPPVVSEEPQATPFPEVGSDLSASQGSQSAAAPAVSSDSQGFESFQRGTELMAQGKNADALKELQAALAVNPQLAEGWYNQGLVYQRMANLSEAENSYRRALEIKPDMVRAMVNLSEVYRLGGNYDSALDQLSRAARQAPKDSYVRNQRIAVLRAMGRNDEAIAEARAIIEENSNDQSAFINLGMAYHAKGDLAMATLVYEKAIFSFKEVSSDPYVLLDYGLVLYEQGLRQRAIVGGFDPAIQASPNFVPALVTRANLHLEDSENEKALELLTRATEAEPTNIPARLSLAVAQRRAGQYEAAKAQYDIILTQDPKHYQSLYNCGILLSNYIKDQERALEMFRRAREVAPNEAARQELDGWISEAEKLIKRAADQRARDLKRAQEEAAKAAAASQAPPPSEGAAPSPATPEGAAPGSEPSPSGEQPNPASPGAESPAGGSP